MRHRFERPAKATGISPELFQGLAHALDLPGMGVASDLPGQARCKRGIGLAQLHPGFLRQRDQLRPGPFIEPRVRRMGDGLLHDGRVHGHPLEAALVDGPRCLPGLDGLCEHPFDAFFANPLAPSRQRGRVDRRAMLEEYLAGEMLVVRVLHPAGDDGFIGKAIGMLEVQQACHQARRRGRTAGLRREEPGPLALEDLPVDQLCELRQFVAQIDHLDQAGSQKVILFWRAGTVLHRRPEIAGFRTESCRTL